MNLIVAGVTVAPAEQQEFTMKTFRTIIITLSIAAGLLLVPTAANAADPDVSINSIYGSLSIVGDGGDNHVIVSTTPPDPWGRVTVRVAVVQEDGSIESELIDGFDGNISISLKGGDDRIVVTKSFADFRLWSHFPGDVRIRTGSGEDEVTMAFVEIAGDLDARTGTGDDDIDARNVEVAGDVNVRTEGGNRDVVEFRSSRIDGGFKVRAGGAGRVKIVASRTVVSGTAVFGDFTSGYDIIADYARFSRIGVYTGGSDDFVQLLDGHLGTDPEIRTYSGDDEIRVGAAYDGEVSIDASEGNDRAQIGNTAGGLDVQMGMGDDRTVIWNLPILTSDRFDGGTGFDTMVIQSDVSGPTTGAINYEEVTLR